MRAEMLPAWHAFLGGPNEVLAPLAEPILAWAGAQRLKPARESDRRAAGGAE
jgi:hypothetical protein